MWVVTLRDPKTRYASGPFASQEQAERFAAWFERIVDPCLVIKLVDPLDEMLSWDDAEQGYCSYLPPQDRIVSR